MKIFGILCVLMCILAAAESVKISEKENKESKDRYVYKVCKCVAEKELCMVGVDECCNNTKCIPVYGEKIGVCGIEIESTCERCAWMSYVAGQCRRSCGSTLG